MSQWITDRLPTEADADCYCNVWDSEGDLVCWTDIGQHEAWCSTNCPGAYQADKQKHIDDDMWYIAKNMNGLYSVHSLQRGKLCDGIVSRDEARKIAAAFAAFAEETLP